MSYLLLGAGVPPAPGIRSARHHGPSVGPAVRAILNRAKRGG